MSEKDIKELVEEDLKVVTGGSTQEDAPETFSCGVGTFTGFIGKYAAEGHLFEMVYFVSHSGDDYYYGELRESFEYETTFWTERTQVMMGKEHNGGAISGIVEVSGDDYYIYKTRTK